MSDPPFVGLRVADAFARVFSLDRSGLDHVWPCPAAVLDLIAPIENGTALASSFSALIKPFQFLYRNTNYIGIGVFR